jgi:transcriptional regulator with XRE-family HTH domain
MADRQSEGVAERFGDNLRRIRRREGLSQEELAVRASLHRTEIGKLENTERLPRIDTLIQLAGAMAIAPGELLDGIFWVPGLKPRGTFTFSSGPRTRSQRQPSTPAIDEAGEVDEP